MIQTIRLNPLSSTAYKILSGRLTTITAANAGQSTAGTISHEGTAPILFKVYFSIDSNPEIYHSPGLFAPTTAGSQIYVYAYVGTNSMNIITGNFTSSAHTFYITYFIYIDKLK